MVSAPDDDAGPNETGEGHSKSNIVGGIAAGGVPGTILGVVALAIMGVGPLVAAGAIAASAVPTAAGVGAAVGATAGPFAKMLTNHDVDGHDAEYFESHVNDDGVFVSVDLRKTPGRSEIARDILYLVANRKCSASN